MGNLRMIFNNNSPTPPTPARLQYELTDFDLRSSITESMMVWEDEYFQITREHMSALHIAMKDGNDVGIMNEAANDFLKSAGRFLGNMIKRFKEVMSKIFMYLNAYIGNFDKFLSKNRDIIDQAEPNFRLRGYDFTFNSSIPKMDRLEDVVNTYNRDLGSVTKRPKEELIEEREKNTSEGYFSSVRSHVLGLSQPVHREDFMETVKGIYRDGDTDPKEMVVDRDMLIKSASDYNLYKKILRDCMKERDKALVLLQNLQSFFERGAMTHYSGDSKVIYAHQLSVKDDGHSLKKTGHYESPDTNSNIDLYNLYYNYKWKQAKEVGFITITAITEKVNALKDALRQSESIIRRSVFGRLNKTEGSAN